MLRARPLTGASALHRAPLTPAPFSDQSAIAQGGLPQVMESSVAWGDYDNDGRLDFLITGYGSSGPISKLYHNTGTAFVDASNIVQGGLPQVYESSLAWGDYDNDGRLDFLLTGYNNDYGPVSKLYRNTGMGFVDASITTKSCA